MLTTIRALCGRASLTKEQTIYQQETNQILDYPLTVGGFFEAMQGVEKGKDYYLIREFDKACKEEEEKLGVSKLMVLLEQSCKQAEEVRRQLAPLQSGSGAARNAGLAKRSQELKSQRKQLRKELEQLKRLAHEAVSNRYGDNLDRLWFLEYKNRVMLTSFDNVTRLIVQLKETRLKELWEFPWLVTGLSSLQTVLSRGEKPGVIGGPCLFGVDEVLLQVELQDGGLELFDCSSGRNCAKNAGEGAVTLNGYLHVYKDRIKNLHILNRKTGITRQEYVSLLYVFEIAACLQGKVAIPLPDMSYLKTMAADLAPLDETLRQQVLAEFEGEAYRICDLFLEVIDCLKARYAGLEVKVLHQRDEGMCQLFYEKRETFLRDSLIVRNLTSMNEKKEAVIDYVTMLALPYYLYGTRHVVQVDSLDETDSGRKCQKLHGENLELHSLLYPEFISRDGKSTIYNAPAEYKDYMESREYQ